MNPKVRLALTMDILVLVLTAPLLYFPERFSPIFAVVGIGIVIVGWFWRRRQLGSWLPAISARGPMLFLFLIMLPIAVIAAPPDLRQQYSLPKALVLTWNFYLFWSILLYASLNIRFFALAVDLFCFANAAIAVVALLGVNWNNKLLPLAEMLVNIPRPLVGVFRGAETGFNPNQVAGSLIYALPVQLALWVNEWAVRRRPAWLLMHSLFLLVTISVFLIAQSRAALIGFSLSLLVMPLLHWRLGQRLLVLALFAFTMAAMFLPLGTWANLFELQLNEESPSEVSMSIGSFEGRQELWVRAVYALSDFPYSGIGLGAARRLVPQLYPFFKLTPNFDIAHVHNFFLQTGLDFGLPGLIAVLALYLLAIVHLVRLLRSRSRVFVAFASGASGSLLAQSIYGVFDAVSMGSKTNLMFWFLFALIFAAIKLDGYQEA